MNSVKVLKAKSLLQM